MKIWKRIISSNVLNCSRKISSSLWDEFHFTNYVFDTWEKGIVKREREGKKIATRNTIKRLRPFDIGKRV